MDIAIIKENTSLKGLISYSLCVHMKQHIVELIYAMNKLYSHSYIKWSSIKYLVVNHVNIDYDYKNCAE